jgi:hypothetical protein
MGKYRYWGMIGLLGAGLALTLAGCGGGGGGSHSSSGHDSTYRSTAVVTTLAGSGASGCDDKTWIDATFNAPTGVALDFSDAALTYLYVADTGSNAIRRIKILTKAVSSIITGLTPQGIVFNNGNIYICDKNTSGLLMLSSNFVNTYTLVDAGTFANPTGIAYDGTYFYIADYINHVIQRVTVSGTTASVDQLAGTGSNGTIGSSYGKEAEGLSAQFENPYGVAYHNNYLYVTDSGNNTIRKIDLLSSNHPVTILAGTAGTIGITDTPSTDTSTYKGESAYFNNPKGITVYQDYLYVADTGNHAIRRINISDGTVETVAGVKGKKGRVDGTGNATKFNAPTGIVSDGKGNLYVADTGNNKIRVIDISTLVIETL